MQTRRKTGVKKEIQWTLLSLKSTDLNFLAKPKTWDGATNSWLSWHPWEKLTLSDEVEQQKSWQIFQIVSDKGNTIKQLEMLPKYCSRAKCTGCPGSDIVPSSDTQSLEFSWKTIRRSKPRAQLTQFWHERGFENSSQISLSMISLMVAPSWVL